MKVPQLTSSASLVSTSTTGNPATFVASLMKIKRSARSFRVSEDGIVKETAPIGPPKLGPRPSKRVSHPSTSSVWTSPCQALSTHKAGSVTLGGTSVTFLPARWYKAMRSSAGVVGVFVVPGPGLNPGPTMVNSGGKGDRRAGGGGGVADGGGGEGG